MSQRDFLKSQVTYTWHLEASLVGGGQSWLEFCSSLSKQRIIVQRRSSCVPKTSVTRQEEETGIERRWLEPQEHTWGLSRDICAIDGAILEKSIGSSIWAIVSTTRNNRRKNGFWGWGIIPDIKFNVLVAYSIGSGDMVYRFGPVSLPRAVTCRSRSILVYTPKQFSVRVFLHEASSHPCNVNNILM